MTKHLKANITRLLDIPRSERWWDSGECLGEDPELFFVPGQPEAWENESHAEQLRAVRGICHACPVETQCLADALNPKTVDNDGFRGGLTPPERKRLQKNARRKSRAKVAG
jgi:hypothetical protein